MEKKKRTVSIGQYERMQLLCGVFLLTLSLFSYQFLLTRLFSTLLSYHFVFIVVSLAIMGTGMGGIITYRYKIKASPGRLNLTLAVLYLAVISFIYFLPFKLPVFFYPLIASIPFIVGGMTISRVFYNYGYISSVLYFADLAGAAAGSILIINFFNRFGFMNSVVMITAMASISAAILSVNKRKCFFSSIILLLIILLMPLTGITKILERNFVAYFTSPYSVTRYFDNEVNVKDRIEYTTWDAISRTDVIDRGDENEKTIITDGGAAAPMVKFDGDLKKVEYLKKESRFIPFSFGSNRSSLLIGSGGGKDILFALLGGSTDIDAVEINSSIINAVKAYKDFNGDIYNTEGVALHVQDGRMFVEETDKKYDNIYLSMVMTSSIKSNSLMLAENYIYTVEAFKAYFSRLKDNGKLSFMLHNKYDLFKALNTGIEALLEQGVDRKKITKHFVIINDMEHGHHSGDSIKISMPVLVFKREPFTESELNKLNRTVLEQGRKYIHLPGVLEIGEYKSVKSGEYDLDTLIKKMSFNAKPVNDESPFFYNFDKSVPSILSAIIILASTAIILFVKLHGFRLRDNKILYFLFLGIAYMLVEIPLLHRMTQYFGSPSTAFSVIIPVLLASSGIGSLFSGNKTLEKYGMYVPTLVSGIAIIALIAALKLFMFYPASGNFFTKVLFTVIAVFPAGFFMGMPFPYGMTLVKSGKFEKAIPLVWSVNGLASVLGSALATVVSMKLGFSTALLLGSMIYLGLFFTKIHAGFIR